MIEYAQHQKDAISFQQVQPFSICALQTGTGKSAASIGSMLVNLNERKLNKCIFVCTKGSIGEVSNDFNKFYDFTPKQIYDGDSIKEFLEGDSTIALSRYEWLKHFDPQLMRQVSNQSNIGMWWDEAQKLKNTHTKAHQYAAELRPSCSAFHAVTATPIMTKLDDLWGIMDLVDHSVLGDFDVFCQNFYERRLVPHPSGRVKNRRKTCPTCKAPLFYSNGWDWCTNPACKSIQTPTGYIPYRVKVRSIWDLVEYKNIDVLSKILQNSMFCFYPEQDIRYHIHKYELDSDDWRNYKAIAKDTILKLDDEDTPFATRLIQLQYLVDRSLAKRQKLYQVANAIKHMGFVLYVPFYESLAQVQEVLGYIPELQVRTYSGKDTDDDRDENKKWFQEDSKNKCLIITAAGGASLNLQTTNQMIFYGLGNGFGAMSQAIGRVVRLFSTFKTFHIHFILGEHTVDEYKHYCFLMYDGIVRALMNNKMISLKQPINFNNDMKAQMRRDWCWLSG